jgi:hypothetical protein
MAAKGGYGEANSDCYSNCNYQDTVSLLLVCNQYVLSSCPEAYGSDVKGSRNHPAETKFLCVCQ